MSNVVLFSGEQAYLFQLYKRGCENKQSYRSSGRAELARVRAMGVSESVRTALEGTRPYSCQFCGQWHLGHGK